MKRQSLIEYGLDGNPKPKVIEVPTGDTPIVNIVNRKDRDRIQEEMLVKRIDQLRVDFEQKYFKGRIQKLQTALQKPTSDAKETLLADYERYRQVRSTLTLAHVTAVAQEYTHDSSNRDYGFLDRLLKHLRFLSSIREDQRLLLYRSASFVELPRGAELYSEGSEGIRT